MELHFLPGFSLGFLSRMDGMPLGFLSRMDGMRPFSFLTLQILFIWDKFWFLGEKQS